MNHPKEFLSNINSRDYWNVVNERRRKCRELFVKTSLHTLGAEPSYKLLGGGGVYKPVNWYGNDYQNRFTKVLMSRHPRESEDTLQWRLSQYRPQTKEAFSQLTDSVLGSLFQDNNYSIIIDSEKDADYILRDPSFSGYDLVNWFVNIGYTHMVNDANGHFLRMPNKPYTQLEGRDVKVYFIPSFNEIEVTEDFFSFEMGGYAYYVDKNVIWRFKKQKDNTFLLMTDDNQGYYSHLLGRLPIDISGGYWNEYGYFESFYNKALPIADEYISSYSAEQLVDKEASHPFIQQVTEKCKTCAGIGQVTSVCGDCNGADSNCNSCHGNNYLQTCGTCSGVGETNVSPGVRINVPYEQMDKDAVRIISPNISINQYHNQKNIALKKDLYRALRLNSVDEAQSGIAKGIDREDRDLFLSKMNNHIFDTILNNTIKDILAYRNVSVSGDGKISPLEVPFAIVKPKQSRIRTTDDLYNEYKRGMESGMPLLARNQMFVDFMDKQYSGEVIMLKKVNIQAYYDVLLCVTSEEKMSMLLNGEVTKDDLILSTRLPSFMEQLITEKGSKWFIATPVKEFKVFIDEKMNALNIPNLDTN